MKKPGIFVFFAASLFFNLVTTSAQAEDTSEFVPDTIVSQSPSTKKEKPDDSYSKWVESIAKKLDAEPTTEKLIQGTGLSDSLKKSLLQSLSAAELSKKISFKSEGELVILNNGKLKATVQILNPVQELFLINDYQVNLFGKSETEKLVYLVKVLKYTLAKPTLKSWFSLFTSSEAHAESQLFYVEDSELSALGIGVDAITNEAKCSACQLAQQDSAASKRGIIGNLQAKLKSYASGDPSGAVKSLSNPDAQSVAASFWCETQTLLDKPITNFHVKCSKDKEVESISYAAYTPQGESTPVGFIRKTKGTYWFGKSAAKVAEANFKKGSFVKNVENCCAEKSGACEQEMNMIAPIQKEGKSGERVHDLIDSKAESTR